MTTSADLLSSISQCLEMLGCMPSHVEHSRIGDFIFVNAFDEVSSPIISESISTGFDREPTLAALKSLVEWTERRAFKIGKMSGQKICQTDRSDGFAAYPRAVPESVDLARKNALSEAIERYAWASWWDDREIQHATNQMSAFSETESELLSLASSLEPIANTVRVQPLITNSNDYEVLIYFATLVRGGVVSGGACGLKQDRNKTSERAIGELIRHARAASAIRRGDKPLSFYERRLNYFLTDEGQKLVQQRIQASGANGLQLPLLRFDGEVSHRASDTVYVHRCLFEKQPPFIGGALERLCL